MANHRYMATVHRSIAIVRIPVAEYDESVPSVFGVVPSAGFLWEPFCRRKQYLIFKGEGTRKFLVTRINSLSVRLGLESGSFSTQCILVRV
ncbi:hypothetical protein TTRE_0000356601 [Trichuris trichiura]|uniref:Uncharacterized protein n=1 Tax=Trichuris trichiura TaxID=36087 RepID=A0A077Z647_TRITR|nr:hypothetical protein TTRE_0000356601 [Trichuris trichiura]